LLGHLADGARRIDDAKPFGVAARHLKKSPSHFLVKLNFFALKPIFRRTIRRRLRLPERGSRLAYIDRAIE
jgi:hypothetical protein